MKDSQIDLGGEGGSLGAGRVPVLEYGESLSFSCSGCGGCCRGREDIVLSGYDLYRICGRLQLPPAVVIRGYCRHYTGQSSRLPVVRLQPLRREHNNCPFLYQNKCSIHDAAPLVCALYPLGQQIGPDGSVAYFMQPIDCGGPAVRASCGEYLERYSVRQREPIDIQWAMQCTRLSRRVRRLEAALPPAHRKMLQFKIYQALYLSLDWQSPYLPQLSSGMRQAEAYLDRVGSRVAGAPP